MSESTGLEHNTIPIENQVVEIGDARVTFYTNALDIDGELSFEEWAGLVDSLTAFDVAARFWLGDCVNYGEDVMEEAFFQVFDRVSLESGTLRNYAWVARRIPPPERKGSLHWSHYVQLASVKDDAKRMELAEEAEENGYTVNELKDKKNEYEGEAEAEPVIVCPYCHEGHLTQEQADFHGIAFE